MNEAAAAQQSADQVRDQAAHVAASEDAATNAAAAKATEACLSFIWKHPDYASQICLLMSAW